jgi:hypothetical protein
MFRAPASIILYLDAESLAKFQRDCVSVDPVGAYTPRPEDEVDVRALLGDLA